MLWRELGPLAALRFGAAVQLAAARGEPFNHLPPAADARERASRAQAGPAILLTDRLCDELGEARGREVAHAVIQASAVVFLGTAVGTLDRDQMASWTPATREAFVRERLSRFPNAAVTLDEVGEGGVRFTVTACRLAELARETGHQALAPSFCEADAHYFGGVQPGVRLDRPTTIARGGATCPFALHWEDP